MWTGDALGLDVLRVVVGCFEEVVVVVVLVGRDVNLLAECESLVFDFKFPAGDVDIDPFLFKDRLYSCVNSLVDSKSCCIFVLLSTLYVIFNLLQ